jgi:hypothetical protein
MKREAEADIIIRLSKFHLNRVFIMNTITDGDLFLCYSIFPFVFSYSATTCESINFANDRQF